MLGKLIKNEFINRGKAILGIYAAVILSVIFYTIFTVLGDGPCKNMTGVLVLQGIFTIAYFIALYSGIVGVFVSSIVDFGNRLFKSQAYLTHTLPVKPIFILLAKVIADICIMFVTAVVYFIAYCIGERNVKGVMNFLNAIKNIIFSQNGIEFYRDATPIITMAFFAVLMSIWVIYASYTIGHCFSSKQRFFSVAMYALIGFFGMSFLIYLEEIFKNSIIFFNLYFFLGFLCMVAITNYCLNRKLNLQ